MNEPESFFATIHVPIYGVRVHVAIAKSLDKAWDLLPKKAFDGEKPESFDCKAYYCYICDKRGQGHIAILFRSDKLFKQFVYHELYHVTGAIFDHIEQAPLDRGSEVEAYLHDWLEHHVWKAIDKSGFTFK